MIKYIIRLDDACPYMDELKWNKIEKILDKYSIKPIVGIIPDCNDKEFLKYPKIEENKKKYALSWQEKKWIIAQHGLKHDLNENIRTEYTGKSLSDQIINLVDGNKILRSNNIKPVCFFAPAHTFDDNTVLACAKLNYFSFISDGVAIYPYKYKGIMFLPNIFDSPHKILPFGIYTFVFHPNMMKENDFVKLEEFIKNNLDKFDIDIDKILVKYSNRRRNCFD